MLLIIKQPAAALFGSGMNHRGQEFRPVAAPEYLLVEREKLSASQLLLRQGESGPVECLVGNPSLHILSIEELDAAQRGVTQSLSYCDSARAPNL